MNGELTSEGIAEQLVIARDKSGFSGIAVLPMSPTKPKYLSDGYFSRYGDILKSSEQLGMTVVFYDDINFPSGTAGGEMERKFPDDLACRLDNTEFEVSGPQMWQESLPEGIFMGAVAMNLETGERHDISAKATEDSIALKVPAGKWKIMLFTCVRSGELVDYLNPDSIDKFFSLTYDEYYKRFEPYFGTTIQMTFFDDIGMRKADRRIWTPAFNEKFIQKNGFSPVDYYPALWYDIGPDTEAARVALFDFRAELMAEGYPAKVHEWAAAHGIQSSGHAMGQYHPQPTFMSGDAIKFYRHSDIPMIDSIHYYGHGRSGFKLTSSASSTYDRPLTSVEIYGNYKEFDPVIIYSSAMELLARGANLFLPHGMWYNPERVGIKPLISDFNPEIAETLPEYNIWLGRSCLLLQGGRHVADIGVLYPIASMQAYAKLDAVVDQRGVKGSVHPGLYVPPQTDMNELSDSLSGEIRRDFTYLHPEILDGRCVVKGDRLQLRNEINFEEYRVVIMPAGRVIHLSSLNKIKAFYDAGGKVIATGLLPSKSAELRGDAEVVAAVKHIFGQNAEDAVGKGPYVKQSNAAGGAAYFVPGIRGNGLASALIDALPSGDVTFSKKGSVVNTKKGMLSYLHKVKEDRNIYYFANSSDDAVDMDVTLRDKLNLEQWDPDTGKTTPLKTRTFSEKGESFTQARLQLDPVTARFFVER